MKPPYNPYLYIDGTNPAGLEKGRFEYWGGTLKQAIQASRDDVAGRPFADPVVLGGLKNYSNSDNTLKLIDSDGWTTSGYVSLKMADGFQGLFLLRTENNDFFEDYGLENIKSDWKTADDHAEELEGQWPTVWVQDDAEFSDSRTMFGLDSGDYVSIDIDAESGDAAQMRVRLGGVDYFDNQKHDNEVFLTMLWIRKWNPDYVNPTFDPEDPPTPTPTPTPTVVCPEGYEDNGYGVCVLIPEPEPEPEPEPDEDEDADVSLAGMIALVGGIALVVVLAVRVV